MHQCTFEYSAVQHSTVQCSAVQRSAVQCSAVQYCLTVPTSRVGILPYEGRRLAKPKSISFSSSEKLLKAEISDGKSRSTVAITTSSLRCEHSPHISQIHLVFASKASCLLGPGDYCIASVPGEKINHDFGDIMEIIAL